MVAGAIVSFLGGKAVFQKVIDSDYALALEVEAGFPSSSLDYVMQGMQTSGAEQSEVYAVVGSSRTLQRKRRLHKTLSRDESDRLARLARIVVRAEEALGSRAKAMHWLQTPNRALDGMWPLRMLGSDPGALVVERILGRIEHGIVG